MGEELYVNYQRTICYYDDYIEENNDLFIAHICRIFKYKNAHIMFNYKNFTEFSENYDNNNEYLSTKLYCSTIYDYYNSSNNKNKHNMSKYYKYEYGFWKLDNIGKEKVSIEIKNKVSKDLGDINWKDFFILIVEKYFHLYKRLEEWMNDNFNNIFNKNYYTFNIIPFLNKEGYHIEDIPSFNHISTYDRGDAFKQIFVDNIRRN